MASFTPCFKPESPLLQVEILAEVAMQTRILCMPFGDSVCGFSGLSVSSAVYTGTGTAK